MKKDKSNLKSALEPSNLKQLLDEQLISKNTLSNLSSAPDPLQVAREYRDPVICLLCALFAYGNAAQIVKFLRRLDFDLLKASEEQIGREITDSNLIYRFQNTRDVSEIFITAKRLKGENVEEIVARGFEKRGRVEDGINALIARIYELNPYRSSGYEFFFGSGFENEPKSPYKRYNMWLRWCIRDTDIDLGLFTRVPKSALILPLDTHTHKVSLALGLCSRKSYDFKAALEITENLRKFDPLDPIKYDFALYRLGQSKEIARLIQI